MGDCCAAWFSLHSQPYATKQHRYFFHPLVRRSATAHAAGAVVRGHGGDAVSWAFATVLVCGCSPLPKTWAGAPESFSLAIAVPKPGVGILGIFVGILAYRWGAFKILIAGAALYALGLAGNGLAPTTLVVYFDHGPGRLARRRSGTTYAVVYGVLGRPDSAASRRSWAMGVTAAAGSFGQFFMVPVEGALIAQLGWSNALLALAGWSC